MIDDNEMLPALMNYLLGADTVGDDNKISIISTMTFSVAPYTFKAWHNPNMPNLVKSDIWLCM